jgi:histidinol phosphatase-like enzyme (inositol monophosphatase family)
VTDDLSRFLALAVRLADAAGPIVMKHYRAGVAVERKPDDTPVTAADRAAETRMRELIAAEFPGHGVIGEEFGRDRPDASHVWVLDPIDGTKSFVSGRPLFGSLIALCRDGVPVVGVIDCPAAGDRWTGCAGRPSTHNGGPARTRACARLADAVLYATSPYVFEGRDRERFDRLHGLIRFPIFGNDCFGYGLAASGWVDLVVEARMDVYDWAAVVPVAEGAGGLITDWRGKALGFASDGRVLLAGDARAHRLALEVLSG